MAHDKTPREINCYEATKDGALVIYAEDQKNNTLELVIPSHDVARLMVAGIDALRKKASRR